MKRFHRWFLIFLLTALPAFTSTLNPLTINFTDGTLPSNEQAALTTIASQYAALFSIPSSSAPAVQIDVLQSNLTNGDVAENTQIYNTVSYSSYYNKLQADESGTNDATAVNSLGSCNGCNNPVTGGANVALTGSLEAALNLGTPSGICFLTSTGCTSVGDPTNTYGSCTLAGNSSYCFNDIITIGSSVTLNPGAGQYDFFTTVEHETDEALGTSSCLNNQDPSGAPQDGCSGGPSAADLFRYSAPGVRSFLGTNGNQAEGSLAYFSINGGTTNIVGYNNCANGADYGDFAINCGSSSSPNYVQNAYGTPDVAGVTIANDGGVELALLDAVGYNLTTLGKQDDGELTPEPSSMVISLTGLGAIGVVMRRRKQSRG